MACLKSCEICNQFYNVRTNAVCPNCDLETRMRFEANKAQVNKIEDRTDALMTFLGLSIGTILKMKRKEEEQGAKQEDLVFAVPFSYILNMKIVFTKAVKTPTVVDSSKINI